MKFRSRPATDLDMEFDAHDSDMDVDEPDVPPPQKSRTGRAVNRLSYDVLHYMFDVCMRTVVGQPELPVALSQVCALWRITALKSPRLWTSVYLRCMRRLPHHVWVRIRLKRSKNLPIDLYVNTLRPFEQDELKYILLPNSHRIRKLSIITSSDILIPILFRELTADMPLLEQFELRVNGDSHRARVSITRRPGQNTTDDKPFRMPPVKRDNTVVWGDWLATRLTSLVIDYCPEGVRPTVNELHSVLSANCSSIENMEFRGFAPELILDDENDMELTIPTLVFPTLTSLTISYVYPADYTAVLFLFQFPNLTSLTLRDLCDYVDEHTPDDLAGQELDDIESPNASPMLSLLSTTSITHLAFYGVRSDEAACVEFIQSQSKLKSVILYDSERAFFQTICTSLPSSPSSSTIYTGEFISDLLITNTTALTVTGYLALRHRAGLPRLHKLTFSSDCVLPAALQEGLRMSMLSYLASGAKVVTIVPKPRVVDEYVPWREYGLLNDRVVDGETEGTVITIIIPDTVLGNDRGSFISQTDVSNSLALLHRHDRSPGDTCGTLLASGPVSGDLHRRV